MSALTAWRAEVAALLSAAGVPTKPYLPEVVRAPSAALLHGDPYIEPGDVFGEVKVNLVVLVAAGTGSNEAATAGLDDLLLKAVEALNPHYGPLTVGEPGLLQSQDQNLLSARFTVSEHFTLEV